MFREILLHNKWNMVSHRKKKRKEEVQRILSSVLRDGEEKEVG